MTTYNCNLCKDTGIVKYKDITPLTDYSWIPWSTRPCKCQNTHS